MVGLDLNQLKLLLKLTDLWLKIDVTIYLTISCSCTNLPTTDCVENKMEKPFCIYV